MNSEPSSPTRRSWPRRLLNRLEVDKAVFFSVALRGWQLTAGLVTAVLMTSFFSKSTQGFYYTFASLVALQSFFELGFNIVVVNLCSHEWSKLRLESTRTIAGDAHAMSRLVHVGRLLSTWYSVAAVLFIGIVGVAGWVTLGQRSAAAVEWHSPWMVLVVISGGLLATVPFHAVLEGCNQVVPISIYRLLQAIAASVAVWYTMVNGGGLWAAVAAAGVRLLGDAIFLGAWNRPFFRAFRQPPTGARVEWRKEIWPLQWRLALQAVAAYFIFSFFTLLMFLYHGPDIAAEMGMTWTVITALQAAALAWVQTRGPRFGMLISQGNFAELDRIFFRLIALAMVAYVAASVAFLCGLIALEPLRIPLAGRLLSLWPTVLLLAGAGAQLIATCQTIYVRAHKREPFLFVSLATALATGILAWWLGAQYGPLGVDIACLSVNLLLAVPLHAWIVREMRRERDA